MKAIISNKFVEAEGDCRSALMEGHKVLLQSFSSHFILPSCRPTFPPHLPPHYPLPLSTYSNIGECYLTRQAVMLVMRTHL